MAKNSIPKRNTITNTHRNTLPPQEQNENDYQSKQPLIRRDPNESNGDFYHRQKAAKQKQEDQKKEQSEKKPEKNGLAQRGKNYANDKINKAKEYGTQKGKEALGKGAEYAKGKGQEFLKNQKVAGSINRAKEAKENFENRMNQFRDSAEESMRQPALKQGRGEGININETDKEFLDRQRAADKTGPENLQRMSLKDAAIQHGKNEGKKRLKEGANFAKRKATDYLAKNPKTAAKLKEAKEKAEAFKKRSEEIKKLATEKKKNFTDKINKAKAYKKKLQDKLNIKKRAAEAFKKRMAQYAIRFLWPAISGILLIMGKLFLVVLAVVVIISALRYTCESNPLFDAVCSTITDMAL